MFHKISGIELEQLKSVLEDKGITYLTSSSPDFQHKQEKWSEIGSQRAGILIFPESAQDVAQVVMFTGKHRIDLAVRCGGHSTDTAASTDGGILIDLQYMNKVRVDATRSIVTVQGGALWADVNRATEENGLRVVGGTASQVGVGGLTLRGGYGYLTPQYGLVVDNIIAAQVVTGQGNILNVSAEENQDLFWGIRGAGANLGVVTSLDFQAYSENSLVWSGIRTFASENSHDVICGLNHTLHHPYGKSAAQCMLGVSSDTGHPVITVVFFFDGSAEDAQQHFGPLLAIEYLSSDISMRSLAQANSLLDSMMPAGGRKKMIGLEFGPIVESLIIERLIKTLAKKISTQPEMGMTAIDIDYFSPNRLCRIPVPKTAFPRRTKNLNGTLLLQWDNSEIDVDVMEWGSHLQLLCEEEVLRMGHSLYQTVSNFTGYTQEDGKSAEEMFGMNAMRLIEVKKQYDPDNIFHKLNPVPVD